MKATKDLRSEIDAWSERIYPALNNGVYRAGFATTQEAYEGAFNEVFDMMGVLERRLGAGGPFLFGTRLTETDIRLFVTLARFDAGYNPMAGVTSRRLSEFGNLWGYARDLYQRPAFRETTDFSSFGGLVRGPKPTFVNDAPWRIGVEPHLADWDEPAGRDHLG